jgi:hypothetical protein
MPCRWLLPENLPEEDKHVIQSLKRVVECRSMADHHKVGAHNNRPLAVLANDANIGGR